MRRARGFTLIEILIAVALAAISSAFLLMITRTQMVTYEMNDQVNKAQQNGRAALNFVEQLTRRACSGMSLGDLQIEMPGQAPFLSTCVRTFDGAVPTGGTFTPGVAASASDAIEVVYGTTPMTRAAGVFNLAGAPYIDVVDVTGFSANDLVVITDDAFKKAWLFQIQTIAAGATPPGGRLTFATPGGAIVTPAGTNWPDLGQNTMPIKLNVFEARSFSLYVSPDGMLMYDPDGMAGTSHADAQPLAEGVFDFQVAAGVDGNNDGVITENVASPSGDEWIGNAAGETLPASWTTPATIVMRELRLTLVVRTINVYSASLPAPGPFEDRTTYPATTGNPRYRALRINVAPRVWNMNN